LPELIPPRFARLSDKRAKTCEIYSAGGGHYKISLKDGKGEGYCGHSRAGSIYKIGEALLKQLAARKTKKVMAGKNEIKEALRNVIAEKILYDEPMSRHTSLNVGGHAGALVFIKSEDQLVEVVRRLRENKINYFSAGNLTNIIVRDGGYREQSY